MKINQKSLKKINNYFTKSSNIYSIKELGKVISEHSAEWELPEHSTRDFVIEFLLNNTKLRYIEIKSKEYQGINRFIWGRPSPYSVALSMRGGHLTHGTAAYIHELTNVKPKTIYVNKEQSIKKRSNGSLSQENIDRAFQNQQRSSNYIFSYDRQKILLISGKNTKSYGITKITHQGELLSLTNISRTLIDITVRPNYAGGVREVARIYKAAQQSVKIQDIVDTLDKLDYLYPYHQAIGFYMSRTGYDLNDLKKLKNIGLPFNFYLDYGSKTKELFFDEEWKVLYPKGVF